MGAHTKKIHSPSFLLFLFVSFALIVSSIQIVFTTNTFAAPTTSEATCKAAGGEWKNLAPTGGVPEMGCSGVSIAAQQSLDWQVQSLLYYRALGKCFNQASRTSISYEKVKSGEWFQDGYVAIGPYMRDVFDDVGDDSVMTCSGDTGKALVNKALSLWGIKGRDLLCGAGFTWNQFPNNSGRCQDSSITDGDFLANKFWNNEGGPNPGTDGYIQGREANVLTYIKNQIYSGATPELNNAGWYLFYRKVFFQQCDTTQKMSGGTTTKPSGTDKRDVELTIVGDDGASVKKWYRIDASMGTNQFKTRLGGYPGYSDVNKTCQEVAKYINDNATVYAKTVENNPQAVEPGDPSGTTGGEDGSNASTCAIPGVGWIICPVTSFLADIADNAFTFLSDNFLRVDVNTVSATGPTFTVWSSMRSIANVAFVIAFIIIIFSQLTGQGIANYGIKKMLPRLIIAAILVNVSFFICQLAIDLSNILGVSIKQAFDAAGGGIELPAAIGSESGNWAGIATAVIAGTGIAWALGVSVLLPFLLAAVIAFIMVFLILVVRQMLIILLVVVAPIAFVAFLLPNTEQWFTKWRKMFVGLLLVFPLIGLLFGAAGLASKVINVAAYSSDNDTSGWIAKIVAAGVVALPLFLLPSLLRKSLDATGNIGQTINRLGDKAGKGARNKAANSGVMKSLGARKARRRAEIGAGIYSGRNPVSRARSAINSRLNKSDAYNALTGDYGTIRGANIDKLEGEETRLAESAVLLQARSGKAEDSASSQFAEAVKKGDVKKALAAQNILMKSGGFGVAAVREGIAGNPNMSGAMRSALSTNITENHGQAAKGKSADVMQWAKSGGAATMASVSAEAGTWNGLSAKELSDQHDSAFERAMQSGGVSAETLKALSSPRMQENLSDRKRAALSTALAASRAASVTGHQQAGTQTTQQTVQGAATTAQTTQTAQQAAPQQGPAATASATQQQNAMSAAERARQTAEQAAQGTSGDGVFVVSHDDGITKPQEPVQPTQSVPPAGTPAGQATTTVNEHGQMGVAGQHEDTIDRMSR